MVGDVGDVGVEEEKCGGSWIWAAAMLGTLCVCEGERGKRILIMPRRRHYFVKDKDDDKNKEEE
jgi:hypothetical protein